MNPSSDNDRLGREGGREEEALRHHPPQRPHSDVDPQDQLTHEDLHQIHQTHHPADSCGRCWLLCRPHISSSDIPEEQVSQLQSNRAHHHHQHDLASSPPHHPPPHFQRAFGGSDLVDWLIGRGLCAGRAEARLYARRLQLGGVIDDPMGGRTFRDDPALLYHFTQREASRGGAGRSQSL